MRVLRVGVVGVGHIGANHARIYGGLDNAKFTAIHDIDVVRGRYISEKFRAATTSSLEEFANLVDAVSIATPTPTHYGIAKFLLERGKHLLVEKPITEKPHEAAELTELAGKGALVLQVGHVER